MPTRAILQINPFLFTFFASFLFFNLSCSHLSSPLPLHVIFLNFSSNLKTSYPNMISLNFSQMIVWAKRVPIQSLFQQVFILSVLFFTRTFIWLISLASNSNPLISIIIAAYSLILLYLPTLFFQLVLSPVLICTSVLLAGLLRLGAIQRDRKDTFPVDISAGEGDCKFSDETENGYELGNHEMVTGKEIEIDHGRKMSFSDHGRKVSFSDVFVEWNRRGPLEVIYEEYEGEEEEEDDDGKKRDLGFANIVPLTVFSPDSDSGSSSESDFPAMEDWDLPENLCFRWDEDGERNVIEGDNMIEIWLERKAETAEEENLIEIDLSDQKILKGPRNPATMSFTCLD